MFDFFKKKRHFDEFFGELVFSGGYWNGEKTFSPLPCAEIGIHINCQMSDIGRYHVSLWEKIESQYKDILKQTIIETQKCSERLLFDLKQDFDEKDLQLESIVIDSDNSIDINWGIAPLDTTEFEYGLSSSYKNGKIEINGSIH